ncbi:facilitated trehalose transporter Tret1-like [Anticarsia gemmatalis]|uniref:facilitated trehalose transporter Tret1-like n=1 Tax=Anticarsia gemmatalis TaxID=129554 RepID=UPI003F766A6C
MEKGRRIQYFVAFAIYLASMTAGVSVTWSTPVIAKFHNNETEIHMTESEISWLAAIGSPGYMTGTLWMRYSTDRFGRRATILTSAVPIITGTVLVLFSTTAWMFCLTRFAWGVGCGMIGAVGDMYIAEISDKEIRGKLLAANRYMANFGSLLALCVGPFVSYQTLSYLLLVLPICFFVACYILPESPYFLLRKGNVNAARKALVKLSGREDEKLLEEKLSSMRADVRKEMSRSGTLKELFTGKQYRKALIIVVGLKVTQMMSGSIPILQYLGRIVQDSTTTVSVSTALIVFGTIRFIVGVFLSVIVDKVGRRPLLLYSYLFSGITLGIVGAYFLIEPTTSTYYSFIPFVGIVLCSILATFGYDTLGYVVVAEVFPINVKSVAVTFVNIFGGVLTFLSLKGYQEIKDVAGMTGVFWFYSISALAGAVFTFFVMPETKGNSLREIQMELQGSAYDEAVVKLNQVVVSDDKVTAELKQLGSKVTLVL